MKWNKKDIENLKKNGFDKDDIAQIKTSGRYLKLYILYENEEVNKSMQRITQKEAIDILGKDTFISGMSRAAFHFTSTRTNNYRTIYFDCSSMFKNI